MSVTTGHPPTTGLQTRGTDPWRSPPDLAAVRIRPTDYRFSDRESAQFAATRSVRAELGTRKSWCRRLDPAPDHLQERPRRPACGAVFRFGRELSTGPRDRSVADPAPRADVLDQHVLLIDEPEHAVQSQPGDPEQRRRRRRG